MDLGFGTWDLGFGVWVLGFLLVALIAACATNPVTGQRQFTLMSEAQEIGIGRESDPQIKAEMDIEALHAKRLKLFGVSNKMRNGPQRGVTVEGFKKDFLPLFAAGKLKLDRRHIGQPRRGCGQF